MSSMREEGSWAPIIALGGAVHRGVRCGALCCCLVAIHAFGRDDQRDRKEAALIVSLDPYLWLTIRQPLSLFVFLHRCPGLIGVEELHLLEFIERCRPKIFLVDHPVIAHDERLHSGHPVFSWCSYQSEASDHHASDHEVHFAMRRGRTLPLENLEEITVVRLGSTSVTLFNRSGSFFTEWTAPRAIRISPGQAILLAGSAEDALRVLIHIVAFARFEGVFLLRLHVVVTDGDDVEFVGADAPVEKFLPAGRSIERPFGAFFHDGHWERPVPIAHDDEGAVPILWLH